MRQDSSGKQTARARPLRRPRRRIPLQQRGNHGVSDDPPKTLSSRFQTLSKLQPVEPPQATHRRSKGGCRRPRPPRRQKDRFSFPNPAEQQSRIVLLAPLPDERKPAIGWLACNALIPPRAINFSDISWAPPKVSHKYNHRAITACRLRFSSPTFRKIRVRFFGSARASAWPPISSNLRAFRCPTGISAGPGWTISTR